MNNQKLSIVAIILAKAEKECKQRVMANHKQSTP